VSVGFAMRRFSGGLGTLIILSAVVLPLWVVIANSHLHHWVGGHGADGWRDVVRPWGIRVWSGLLIVGLAGWAAAGAVAQDGHLRLRDRLFASLAGCVVCGFAAVPGCIWLSKLGDLDGAQMSSALALGIVPMACASLVSGAVAGLVGLRLGLVIGVACGGCALWLTVSVA